MSSQASKIPPYGSIKVFYFLVAFRICNALLLQTFFQPDEYFQSLEPAWYTAFGDTSGAWITWEWKQMLRSSLHPFFFSGVYRASDFLVQSLQLSPSIRAEIILAAPKVVQALFAAATDYYTWKLAQKAHGATSKASYGALVLTICSPWQWFCSTRTLSNSVETTLTAVALYFWPFEASLDSADKISKSALRQMRVAFTFAAIATILRPTNTLIWMAIVVYTALTASNVRIIGAIEALIFEASAAAISGSVVLALSIISDRLYYNQLAFPPLRFIHFNVVQSLAVFYGRNRSDYYVTEGLPLLLTTSLPFVAVGWFYALSGGNRPEAQKSKTANPNTVLRPLALCAALFIAAMSMIAHKEVRFIYPLLPALNVLGAAPFSRFLTPLPWPRAPVKKVFLGLLLAVNISLAFYISRVHQRGVVDVTHFLRRQFEDRSERQLEGGPVANMTVTFLMPCHSTPWRSHLVYDGIAGRALTCEPPIDVPVEQRASYLDEADVFYADPKEWMLENLASTKSIALHGRVNEEGDGANVDEWPDYLVFFEQLEPLMTEFLKDTLYNQCWRGFNTHWHDDARRRGDVVAWCLSKQGLGEQYGE